MVATTVAQLVTLHRVPKMAISEFEIDSLPVGEKSSSGDAILFKYKEERSSAAP